MFEGILFFLVYYFISLYGYGFANLDLFYREYISDSKIWKTPLNQTINK